MAAAITVSSDTFSLATAQSPTRPLATAWVVVSETPKIKQCQKPCRQERAHQHDQAQHGQAVRPCNQSDRKQAEHARQRVGDGRDCCVLHESAQHDQVASANCRLAPLNDLDIRRELPVTR